MDIADAFLLLQNFRRQALPTMLRKLQIWKGLHPERHADLIDDLQQELWLDCLENPEQIVALPTKARHARWFRLLERSHYRLVMRSDRVRTYDAPLGTLPDRSGDAEDSCAEADPVEVWGGQLDAPRKRFLRRVSANARYLKNGRINCRVSARRLGIRPEDLKAGWSEVATELGFDDAFLEFWCQRLFEALVGLASDLLRDAGVVFVHGEDRRGRPDPRGRLKRIARLRSQLGCRPIPPDLKSLLSHYPRYSTWQGLAPRRVLEDAAELRPDDPGVHLWMFEAQLAAGDVPAAIRAIRRARAHGADRIRVLLARARILEVRGKEPRAQRLLAADCTSSRWDPRLRSALSHFAS